MGQVNNGEPDEEGSGSDDFEVDQRFRAHSSDLLERAPPAIPTTMVEMTSGAMIDLIRLRKMSRRK